MKKNKYKRVLFKISGEFLGGNNSFGFDNTIITNLAKQVAEIHRQDTQIALVIGGGNFFRGAKGADFDRVSADHIGMLATVMNGLYMQQSLEQLGIDARLMTGLSMIEIAEAYAPRKAIYHLMKERVVILSAGTGNPYFTTDTAAVLRAKEIKADIVIKGTMVDGVYDKDPKIYSEAQKYDRLNYDFVLKNNLRVMDTTAIAFAKEYSMPIYVFNCSIQNALKEITSGIPNGTLISVDN